MSENRHNAQPADRTETPVSFAGLGPVLIAAGGTGGHVIPAQAVAAVMRRRWPDLQVHFVCGMRPVELRTYWNNREQPYLLRCGKAPGSGLGGLQRWMQLLSVVIPADRLVAKLKPRVVMGMGGYIAAPILLAARRRGIPIVLHDSNAISGRTTRLFSRWAREVLLTHAAAAEGLAPGCVHSVVGTPVRPELFEITRAQGAEVFELDPTHRTILVIGGSQGARGLNSAIQDSLRTLESVAHRTGPIQVLWSTGTFNYSALSATVESMELKNVRVVLQPMIARMDAAYAISDLVISRSGAGTLAEISALGMPSILVPYPHAKDDHQRFNARSLAESGAALLVEEDDLGPGAMGALVERLFADREGLRAMARAAKEHATPQAADLVADALVRVGYPEQAERLSAAEPIPVGAISG